jgi:hypothetical protein
MEAMSFGPSMPTPSHLPTIIHDGLVIWRTDYGQGEWGTAGIPYLHNHRGVLQLLLPPAWQDYATLRLRGMLVITRGRFPCGCEAIELQFSKTGHHFYVLGSQSNRLPGDPAGKRPWELEVWFPGEPPVISQRLLAVWRKSPLPCLAYWSGPVPEPREIPPRREKQARPHWWPTPNPGGKPSHKTRSWRDAEDDRRTRWYDKFDSPGDW